MPDGALLPEAIFNYVLTVEENVFTLSEGKSKRARKSAQNYANDFFFRLFSSPPPFVKLQKEMFKNCSHGNFHVRNCW